MNPKEFLVTVIRPALAMLNKSSPAAEQLMLGTAVQESDLIYLTQQGGGPALGYFQMEPKTHDDLWNTYLNHKKNLAPKLLSMAGLKSGMPSANLLTTNHLYAAGMARTRYARTDEPLLYAGNILALAQYWGKHYNTRNEGSKIQQFVTKWNTFKLSDAFV